MNEARLRVVSCGPLVSYQDGGRFGMMRFGVPASGPMDRLAHATAHAALGCPPGGTAIEVSMGGLQLVCESGEVTLCIAGGEFQVMHAGARAHAWAVRTLRADEQLSIRPGRWGSWAYLAFAGDLECASWARSTSTHLPSGLGGGAISPGSLLRVCNAKVLHEREGPLPIPSFARASQLVRVVLGPQTQCFDVEASAAFLQEPFTVTSASDRMGMRLHGPTLALGDALSIPSEPIVRGSVQVAGDGVASILLADHQTTGGYPKIATLLSADVDGVAQLRPRDSLRFQAVRPDEAVQLVRAHATLRRRFLQEVARPAGLLADRLMRENLISGMVSSAEDARSG